MENSLNRDFMKRYYKILMLSPDLPFPITSGGRMRMASIVKALSLCGKLHIACLSLSKEIPVETMEWCDKNKLEISHYQRKIMENYALWLQRFSMFWNRHNLHFRPDENDFIQRVINNFNPNIIWLETPYLIRYAVGYRNSDFQIIVDYWGTSEGAKRDFQNSNGIKKIWDWFRWRTARGGEEKFAKKINAIVVTSKIDAKYFSKIAPNIVNYPIPNGIVKDIKSVKKYYKINVVPGRMVFTGDMSYRPNIDAMIYFCKKIMPIITAKNPEVTLEIAGRNPTMEIMGLGDSRQILITGFVADILESIQKAELYVLPMRLGSGIRSKLFDVFPLGKALVSTSIGAEGLELKHRQNCLIADNPEDFAQACIDVLDDVEIRHELGEELRKLATEIYTQKNVNTMIASLFHAYPVKTGCDISTHQISQSTYGYDK